ncbi:terpene synthase family protein [Streptomyces sp. ISL-11]|uniref:terpene synthase family protein n=1 Tax=Streptomyces sp. ISL-11 TaxID=2819174 RepID=UPI001BE8FAAA|nr:terpene synthase family protein [Streptomyces sp. ISL-11]MBT2386388.1 hypothetical protein [Streptomyces sp. ISL-11]
MKSPTAFVSVQEIYLLYPEPWNRLPAPGPDPDPEQEVQLWLDRLGLLSSAEERRRYNAILRSDLFARRSYPTASPVRQAAIARLLALWAFHDDRIEGVGIAAEEAERIGRAVTGELPEPPRGDRYTRGWWELGREFRRAGMSTRWIHRLGRNLTAWYHSTNDEAAIVERLGRFPGSEEYVDVRRRTSGQTIWLDLLQYAYDHELPAEAYGAAIHEAYHLTETLYVLFNDLYGVEKDERDGLPNLVCITAREHGLSPVDACRHVAGRHAEVLDELHALGRRIRAATPSLAWWLEAFHQLIVGVTEAHQLSPRYAPVQRMSDHSAVRVQLVWKESVPEALEAANAPAA